MRFLLLLLVAGCAHAEVRTEEKQDQATFCPGVTLRQAEKNLSRAGWNITSSGGDVVETGWGGALGLHIFAPTAMSRYRYTVQREPGGVRWSLYLQARTMPGPLVPPNRIRPERRCDRRLCERELATYRRFVCGAEAG